MRSEKLLTKLILILIEGYTLLLLLWMIASVIPNIGKIKNQLLNGTFNGELNYVLWISIWVLLPVFLWSIILTATIFDLRKLISDLLKNIK